MLAYILQFNLTILFIKGARNLLADALSNVYQDSTVQERADHQATFMHETNDFVLPVTTRSTVRTALNGDRDVQRAPQISDSSDAPHGFARADDRGVNGPAEQATFLLPEPASDGNKTPPQIDADRPTDESGKGTDTLSDPQTAMNNDEPPVTFAVISPQDYETDAEFVNMYRYLMTDELTNNAHADKTTLIMADKYTIQNDLLYRMDLPRQK